LLAANHNGPVLVIPRQRDSAVLEMAYVLIQTLNVGHTHAANLARVKPLETMIGEDLLETRGVGGVMEIYECIPDIASIVNIHWEVEEIVRVGELQLIDFLQQCVLGVLVWDVSEHHGGHRLVLLGRGL
jgi:hypothetical protein